MSAGARVVGALVLGLLAQSCMSRGVQAEPREPPSLAERLARAESWAYWLQGVDLSQAARLRADVLVTDPSRDGTRAGAWSQEEVSRLVGRRLLLAYLSVGEAESYRSYWRAEWSQRAPSWLGPENPEWEGNYPVRYWDPAWQKLILSPEGPLARALRAGFHGLYLDRVDVYEYWVEQGLDPKVARARMAEFVRAIVRAARDVRSDALIVIQNGGEIACRPEVLAEIDGLALEDTFFDGDEAQDPEHTRVVLQQARRVRRARKPVFAVDYCTQPKRSAEFVRRARAEGLIPYVTTRALDAATPPPLPPREGR